MMEHEIKLSVVDQGTWIGNNILPGDIHGNIPDNYKIIFSKSPNFLIYDVFGTEYNKYKNCIRIFRTNENVRPNFNECDYAIGFDRILFGERYIRKDVSVTKPNLNKYFDYFNRKFCNFIYSNAASGKGATMRQLFFHMLSKYKHIDSPGQVLNNMKDSITPRFSNWIQGKMQILPNYKFTIAFENESYPGYITEKLIHPFLCNSIPIYFGDPDVLQDFNKDAFINIASFKNLDDVIDYIIFLDNDESAYMHMLAQPAMNASYTPPDIKSFLKNIFDAGRDYHNNTRNGSFIEPRGTYEIFTEKLFCELIKPVTNLCNKEPSPSLSDYIYINSCLRGKFYDDNLIPLFKKIKQKVFGQEVIGRYVNSIQQHGRDPIQLDKILNSAIERMMRCQNDHNAVHWSNDTPLSQHYRQLFTMLWPQDIPGNTKIRVGGERDGGYVQLDQGRDGVALSFEVSTYSPWDLEMAQNGWQVWQFDGTIKAPPQQHRNMRFFPKNLVASAQHKDNEISLSEILAMLPGENDIILQIDIEGAEWDLFEALSTEELQRFSQIIAEFHGLTTAKNLERYKAILTKLCQSHAPIHFHYNNNGHILGFSNFLVSSLWEISFVRRDKHQFTPSQAEYPTSLDRPNVNRYPDVYIGKFADITGANTHPSKAMPESLHDAYTMNGKIPVQQWYFDNRVSTPVHNTEEQYRQTIAAIKNGTLKYYGDTFQHILAALQDFPVSDKTVMIAGLAGCNCDAIALAYGAAKVIAVDYNPPQCDHELVTSMGIEEFAKSDINPDFAFSISSYEHDGLGRYGDPLDPYGDFRAMRELHSVMARDGIVFLAVPAGSDCLVWNAHRIYGRLRLPLLLEGWTFLAAYGFRNEQYDTPQGNYVQPVLVLSANPLAVNIPEWVQETHKKEIRNLAANRAFDRQYYIVNNPDVLTGAMDVVSHYVLYGAKEGRSPAAWFDPAKYVEAHPDLGGLTPFAHYLATSLQSAQ